MEHKIIEENGRYALILRGETQYAVVGGPDGEAGNRDRTCCSYGFGEPGGLTRAEALFRALDCYLALTSGKHVSWARLGDIAAALKDGLIEDDMEEAYVYMAGVIELSDAEAEYLGLDMDKYREAAAGRV